MIRLMLGMLLLCWTTTKTRGTEIQRTTISPSPQNMVLVLDCRTMTLHVALQANPPPTALKTTAKYGSC
jgi:hypothetical protein